MAKVTLPVATAFMRLRAPELAPIVAHLEAELSEAREQASLLADDLQLRRAQGRAQLAKELLDLIDNAQAIAAKLNASR